MRGIYFNEQGQMSLQDGRLLELECACGAIIRVERIKQFPEKITIKLKECTCVRHNNAETRKAS